MRYSDAARRIESLTQFYIGKNICDVGCGEGLFLKGIKHLANSVCGVDLQEACIEELKIHDITCQKSLGDYSTSFDTIFLFHSLEHFYDPIGMLQDVKGLKEGGRVVIEVPNANDILLTKLFCEDFKNLLVVSASNLTYQKVHSNVCFATSALMPQSFMGCNAIHYQIICIGFLTANLGAIKAL